jgi:branched-chain amino acid transport system ATP-binding protein
LLTLRDVSTFYRQFEALRSVSLEVAPGEMVGIIGANGAGKTTMLRTICGLERNRKGAIVFDGEDISRLDTVARTTRGLVYCPESRKLFPDMTVRENLEMGAYLRPQEMARNLARVLDLFPILAERQRVLAKSLSGGQQQMLAIGRALMSNPRLLLFDEPSTGLAPLVAEQLMQVIATLNKESMTVLLVEQNVNLALEFVHRGYVLENGRTIRSGSAQELRNDEEIKRSYLGG